MEGEKLQAKEQGVLNNRDYKLLTYSKYVSDLDVDCVEKVLAEIVSGKMAQGSSYEPSAATRAAAENIYEKNGGDIDKCLAEIRQLAQVGARSGDADVDLAKRLADSVFDVYEAQNVHQLAAARGVDMLEASIFRWLRKK